MKKLKDAGIKFADLHVHTTCSDGTYTPAQLVKEAVARGVSALAIVDHDTVGGIAEAVEQARGTDLEIIPGVELTAQYENQEVHILGYFLDYRDETLLKQLKLIQLSRVERVYKIIKNLNAEGLELDPQVVFDISGEASVGRMHIARALVKGGFVGSTSAAFNKYIGDRCPAYVCGFSLSVPEAIKLIRGAGGVAVLAHPYLLRNDALIAEFAGQGLEGIEVYYPEHSQGMINFYLELADKLKLLVTGGSDFHGSLKPDIKLGMIKVPMELVEKLKARQKND